MANVIGEVKDLFDIDLSSHNILCGDDNCLCGDACSDKYRCSECTGMVLGDCLFVDKKLEKSNVLDIAFGGVSDVCDDCGKCGFYGWV